MVQWLRINQPCYEGTQVQSLVKVTKIPYAAELLSPCTQESIAQHLMQPNKYLKKKKLDSFSRETSIARQLCPQPPGARSLP